MSEHAADDELVVVRRHAGHGPQATYRLADIDPRAFSLRLDAWVWCNAMLSGSLAHSCQHGAPPHRVRVTVSLDDNRSWSTFQALISKLLATPDRRQDIAQEAR